MIRKFLALAILLLPLSCSYQPAMAQTCPTRPAGDNSNACASTAFVHGALPVVPSPANPTASVGNTVVNGTATTYMRSDAAPPLGTGVAAANVGTLGGVLGGTLPNPSMAAGAAATNVGTLGGDLSGTLPNPTVAKVQGLAYKSAATYTSGQVPTWNSTNSDFEPGSGGGGGTGSSVQNITSCNGTGDDAAFTAALAALPATGGIIYVTAPTTCMITSSSTLAWSGRRVIIRGTGGGYVSGYGTVIQCSVALTGPCITMGNGSTGQGAQSAIEDIKLLGSDTGASARDGVLLQCNNCLLQNVMIQNFGGFCVHILSGTSASSVPINANNWQMRNVYCTGNWGGTGNPYEIAIDGVDSNAGTAVGVTVNTTHSTIRASIRDASEFGNTWIGPSCVGNVMSVSCFMIDGYPSESAGTTYKGRGVVVQGLYAEAGVPYGVDITSGSAGGNNVNFLEPSGSTAYLADNTTNHNNLSTWWNATSYCQYLNGTKTPAGC